MTVGLGRLEVRFPVVERSENMGEQGRILRDDESARVPGTLGEPMVNRLAKPFARTSFANPSSTDFFRGDWPEIPFSCCFRPLGIPFEGKSKKIGGGEEEGSGEGSVGDLEWDATAGERISGGMGCERV